MTSSTVHTTILDQDSPERSDQTLAAFIAHSFHGLPPARWIEPDPEQRPTVLKADFIRWIGHARHHGEIHTATVDDQLAGVAVWLDMTGPLPTEPALDTTGLSPDTVKRLTALDAHDAHHFATPHQYLALLAVHPDYQRRRVGTALLDLAHTNLDALDHTACLYAGSEAAATFYARSGWCTSPPIFLPDGGPPMWPMTRPPARTIDPVVLT